MPIVAVSSEHFFPFLPSFIMLVLEARALDATRRRIGL